MIETTGLASIQCQESSDMSNYPKSYQVASQIKQQAQTIQESAQDLMLRKWCIEKAIEAGLSGSVVQNAKAFFCFVNGIEIPPSL